MSELRSIVSLTPKFATPEPSEHVTLLSIAHESSPPDQQQSKC
jgi:hypothetical protein